MKNKSYPYDIGLSWVCRCVDCMELFTGQQGDDKCGCVKCIDCMQQFDGSEEDVVCGDCEKKPELNNEDRIMNECIYFTVREKSFIEAVFKDYAKVFENIKNEDDFKYHINSIIEKVTK